MKGKITWKESAVQQKKRLHHLFIAVSIKKLTNAVIITPLIIRNGDPESPHHRIVGFTNRYFTMIWWRIGDPIIPDGSERTFSIS